LIVTDDYNQEDLEPAEHFTTSFGVLEPERAFDIITTLANQLLVHALTSTDTTALPSNSNPFVYTTTDRYTSDVFYGIMINIGASKKSTAGYSQYLAYKKTHSTTIDTDKAGTVHVQFGIRSILSIGSIVVDIPVRSTEFYIVKADTLFLLCLKDIDTLGVYYNNLKDLLVVPFTTISVIRRFGHPFIL
jgi:hypothetical protein